MCFETIICYTCGCKVILTNICYEHIVHTLKQKDNTTCLYFQREQRREKSIPYRCSLRSGTVLDDGTVFHHGSQKLRVEYKFETDPNGSGKLLSGRRGTGRRYEGSSVSSLFSQDRPQIKQEEPTETKIKSEHPPQPHPSWLNPSSFYNTEPHCSHLPPAYTPTSSRLLMPYDPDAEISNFGGCPEVMDGNRRGKSMIKKEHGEENENQDIGDTNDKKRVKVKQEFSFYLGDQTPGASFRDMEREFEEMKNLLWRGHEERKRRRDGDMDSGGSDDVDMK